MAGRGGGELGVELVIGDSTGTWRFTARGGRAKDNPCIGKELPIEVASQSDAEVRLKVEGGSVIRGCVHQTAMLRSTAPDALEGALADGRALKFTRR